MFAQHQKTIGAYAQASSDNLARVLQFAMLSAHAPFDKIGPAIKAIHNGAETPTSVLFGHKAGAWAILWGERETNYGVCQEIARALDGQELALSLVHYLADLPGLGLIKAGFAAQLAYGVCGCLDTHNLARYGYDARSFRSDKYKECKPGKAKNRRLADYVLACYAQGGPEKLWDSWCAYVARQYPATYRNAWHVSALHCEALNLETGKEI